MKTRSLALPLLGTAALLTVLAGCTNATSTDSASKKPSTSASQPASQPTGVADEKDLTIPTEEAQVDCKDGVATIDGNTKNIPTKVDCAQVVVTGNDSIIHLGAVEKLVVKGSLNRIELDSVKSVEVDKSAQTNDVLYAGAKPSIDDKGRSTQFAAK